MTNKLENCKQMIRILILRKEPFDRLLEYYPRTIFIRALDEVKLERRIVC